MKNVDKNIVDLARSGDLVRIKAALANGCSINTKCPRNSSTPLIAAAGKGQAHVVEYLLQCGAETHHENDDGSNAFDAATGMGHPKIAQMLAESMGVGRQSEEEGPNFFFKFGILGCSNFSTNSLLKHQNKYSFSVFTVASRDVSRARHFSEKYNIPHVHRTYEALLADPRVHAVYIPLPPSLHFTWAAAALQAGKHVLVEKPMCSNAVEAEQLIRMARCHQLVLMEANHFACSALGLLEEFKKHAETARSARATFLLPARDMGNEEDIVTRFDLSGGAMLDCGAQIYMWLLQCAKFCPPMSGSIIS